MFINNSDESKKKIYRMGLVISIALVIIGISYFGYYKYRQSRIHIQPPVGFSVECKTDNLKEAGEEWLEAYTQQYKQKYQPQKEKLLEYSIDNMEIKEENVLQLDFSIVPRRLDEKASALWNGVLEEKNVSCQWVLWFDKHSQSDGSILYTVTKLQRPAGYDLEKYQTSGEKEKDEYEHQYVEEIPYEKQKYTYKIEKEICYISYDNAATWKEVPIALKSLVEVGDGRTYYNQLQQGSYIITPEKTAFVYGGTMEKGLMITYTEDMGTTWNTSEINGKLNSARVKFCSFSGVSVGYVIAAGDRAMSQEMQTIYKTTDKGATWKEVGRGPSNWRLHSGGFVDEKIGFMSYPKVQGAETNFYRTEDGGKTFSPIILPVVKEEWQGLTLDPFIQPEMPYLENGQLILLVGQGDQGDFKGGTVMAKLKSKDMGKTWTLVEIVDPAA